MVKHPKRKGSAFEILLYNDMKTYLTDVKRVGGSGTQGGENGDILCKIDKIEYCIEAKHYKKLTFRQVDKWWEKIKRQAKEINRWPLLIYRQNRQKIMIRCWMTYCGYIVSVDLGYLVWKSVTKKNLARGDNNE